MELEVPALKVGRRYRSERRFSVQRLNLRGQADRYFTPTLHFSSTRDVDPIDDHPWAVKGLRNRRENFLQYRKQRLTPRAAHGV